MVLILLASLLMPYACGQRSDLRAAMAAAGNGNFGPASRLKLTTADVPELAGYLRDKEEAVRREALVLLAGIGGAPACEALAPALTDASADIRERASRALHKCPAGVRGIEEPLRQSIRMGNTAAASLLLLGQFRDQANVEFLKQQLNNKQPVKLEDWSQPVPSGLAAAVAAVSAGVEGARRRLTDGLGPLNEAEFLVSVLPDISDRGALPGLLNLLDDERAVALGVPSGAMPQRRVCDLAVDAFVARLGLKAPFPLNARGRYSGEERKQVRQMAARAGF